MRLTTDIENEVDAIRDKIFEETKDMTPAEHIAHFNAIAENARRKVFRVADSSVAETVATYSHRSC